MKITRKVLSVAPKADDLEVHFCKATLGDVTVLDIRDYIPSTKNYGRGVTMPWGGASMEAVLVAYKEGIHRG